jgi:aldehyde:ferredoxin oxidoreductase
MTYYGKVLRLDLNKEKWEVEELDEEIVRKYIGGRGIGDYILYNEMEPNTDPLSPDNIMVIASGVLTDTKAPSSSRYMVVTKSPLTGTILTANSGGTWGAALRKAGFDVLVIKGKAKKPVYLWIHDGEVEIRKAKKYWGKMVSEVDDALKSETDEKAHVLQCGIAGEKLSKIAGVMNDKYRAAGRGGAGAVMGSKNLKAIVVRGTQKIEVAKPDAMDEAVQETVNALQSHPAGGDLTKSGGALNALGTAVLVNVINGAGILPTRNFQTGQFDEAEDISGETIADDLLKKAVACYKCPIACGRWVDYNEGTWGGKHYEKTEGESLEYETTWAFGAELGINDLDAIARANWICNEYGFDTISAGVTIGFAMEAYEKGLITKDDLGFELKWGDADAMIKTLEMMGKREGYGDILADGSLAAARKIGKGAEEYTMQAKGLELPAYDPRGAYGIGLNYATSNRGGAHVNGYTIAAEIAGAPLKADPFDASADKVGLTILFQNLTAAVDSTGTCLFQTFSAGAEEFAPMVGAVMGWDDFSADEFVKAGERIYALERQFNAREGFGRKDDSLPKRLTTEEMPEGPAKGNKHPLDSMLEMYYEQRGYDEEGHPTKAKLKELGLEA